MLEVKKLENNNDLEKEKRKFEEDLDMQLLGTLESNTKYKHKQFKPVKPFSRLIKTLVISAILVGGIAYGGLSYTESVYSSQSETNIKMVHNAIQFSVLKYHEENRKFPVDVNGNINYPLLQKKGYLTIDIEQYKSNFIFDSKYNVIRIKSKD